MLAQSGKVFCLQYFSLVSRPQSACWHSLVRFVVSSVPCISPIVCVLAQSGKVFCLQYFSLVSRPQSACWQSGKVFYLQHFSLVSSA